MAAAWPSSRSPFGDVMSLCGPPSSVSLPDTKSASAAAIASRSMPRTTWSGTSSPRFRHAWIGLAKNGPPRDVIAQQFTSPRRAERRPREFAGAHPAIAGKCPGQASRDLMRAGLRSQEDAKGLDEPRDRRTGGDTARTRAAGTAQTRPMFERSAVSARAADEP